MTPEEILGKPQGRPTLVGQHLEKEFTEEILDETYEIFETALPIGLGSIDTLVKQLKTYQPTLYKKFLPRIYENVSAFMDWRIPGATSTAIYMAVSGHEELKKYQAYVNFAQWSLQWEQYQNPCFFISPEFLKAMLNTDIPDNFDLSDFKLPFPSMAFILPKDNPVKFRNKTTPFIGITRVNSSTKTKLGEIQMSKPIDKIIVTTSFLPGTFFAAGVQYKSLNQVLRMSPNELREESHRTKQVYTTVEDAEFILLLNKLAVNIVLAMESRPELVTKESYVRQGVSKNKTYRPSVWQPNIIGAKYRFVSPGTGTHESPRSHWRRGHFRQQRIGSSLCSTEGCRDPQQAHLALGMCQVADCKCEQYKPGWGRKTIWIDPVLVNALAY